MFEDLGDHHGYDTAQICLNGHVTNPHHDTRPGASHNFCPDCGAATVTECPICRGWLPGLPFNLSAHMTAPAFCTECGKAYPWHHKRVEAAKQYVDELTELDQNERLLVRASIDDLAAASPSIDTAALRVKRAVAKLPGPAAKTLVKLITEAAVSEAAKAALGALL